MAKRKWQNHGKDCIDPRSAWHDNMSVLSETNRIVDGFSLLRFEFCDLPFDLFFRVCQR